MLYFYEILLKSRFCQMKLNDSCSRIHPIEGSVPQGSVLGPTLYQLFTADFMVTAIFTDDTGTLSSHLDPTQSSANLKNNFEGLRIGQNMSNKDK